MKQNGNFKMLFAATLAFAGIAMFGPLQAQEVKQGEAKVFKIKGSAQFSVPGGTLAPLRDRARLKPGTTIVTGTDSTVDLFLGVNGPILHLGPATTVSLDVLTFSGSGDDAIIETKINLEDGEVFGSVHKIAATSKYEVKTPTGVAGIRGTNYHHKTRKNAAGKWETRYECFDGVIVVADVGPDNGAVQSVVLNSAQGFTYLQGVFNLTDAEVNAFEQLISELIELALELFGPIDFPVGIGPIIVHISPIREH